MSLADPRNPLPRAAAVARALALLVAPLGCGSSAEDPAASPAADAAAEAAVDAATSADADGAADAADAASEADLDAATSDEPEFPPHQCIAFTQDAVPCDQGRTCYLSEATQKIYCDYVEGGVLKPCGDITCGWDCACVNAPTSTCACYGGGGPLAPPDLPA